MRSLHNSLKKGLRTFLIDLKKFKIFVNQDQLF
jgi:hypothetical protein